MKLVVEQIFDESLHGWESEISGQFQAGFLDGVLIIISYCAEVLEHFWFRQSISNSSWGIPERIQSSEKWNNI